MTGGPDAPLGGEPAQIAPDPAGIRVVLDVRPLQAPDRAPLASVYLNGLLGAFDAAPLTGESFAFLIGSDLDDPTITAAASRRIRPRSRCPNRLAADRW